MPVELVVDLFISIDGWAGSDGLPPFFGYSGPDLQDWIKAEKAVPETVVMGRRTYDTFCALPADSWPDDRAYLMDLDKIVFSRTLESAEWPKTRICPDLVADTRHLKADASTRLRTWGSLSLVSQLLSAGLIDTLRLMRFPLFAGERGRQPAFANLPYTGLELVGTRLLDDRLILDEYRPV